MPQKYRVTLSDGRKFVVATEGGPPSEQDVLGSLSGPSAGPAGLLTPGNIDLHKRPVVRNADGSISTVRSMGVNIDGREVLIPTVSDDGRVVSDDEAIDIYRRTGKHLGMFDTPEHATAYAESLHNDQAREYAAPAQSDKPRPSGPRNAQPLTSGAPGLDVATLLGTLGVLRPATATAGALGGAALGGPLGAVGGAAAGGAVGGALQRGMAGEPTSAGDAAWDAGVEGSMQAVPLGAGALLKPAARGLYGLASGASGDAAALGLKKGVTVTAGNAAKLRALIDAAKASGAKPTAASEELAAALASATGNGATDATTPLAALYGLMTHGVEGGLVGGLATRAARSPAVQSGAAILGERAAPLLSRGGPNTARVLEMLLNRSEP